MLGASSWSDVEVDETRDIDVDDEYETAGEPSLLSCSALVCTAREGSRLTGLGGDVFAGV